VRDSKPTSNFGTGTALQNDSRPVERALLKFTVSGVGFVDPPNTLLLV
jgi:hypothetical protein